MKPDRRLSSAGVLAPLRLVWRSRALTELTTISFFYAATQVCLTSFVVVYLTEALHWSLVAAGLALTVTTLSGVAGRVVWGFVADRFLPPRRVLGMLGIVGCGCSLALGAADAAWPALACSRHRGVRRVGDRLERRVARRSRAARAARLDWRRHRRDGVHHLLRRRRRAAALRGARRVTGSYRAGFVVMGTLSGLCGVTLLVRGRRGEVSKRLTRPVVGVAARPARKNRLWK